MKSEYWRNRVTSSNIERLREVLNPKGRNQGSGSEEGAEKCSEGFKLDLDFVNGKNDVSKSSGEIFESIKFLRLTGWDECKRSTTLSGEVACCGQVFRRFRMNQRPDVMLDFWHRGFQVGTGVANDFFRLVSSPGEISLDKLVAVADVLGPIAGAVRLAAAEDTEGQAMIPVEIESQEIRNINGKNVLVVYWSDTHRTRAFVSLFVDADGDGSKVHEIHFSAPAELMEEDTAIEDAIDDTIDSIQWNIMAPPPVPGLSAPISM